MVKAILKVFARLGLDFLIYLAGYFGKLLIIPIKLAHGVGALIAGLAMMFVIPISVMMIIFGGAATRASGFHGLLVGVMMIAVSFFGSALWAILIGFLKFGAESAVSQARKSWEERKTVSQDHHAGGDALVMGPNSWFEARRR